MKNLFKDTRNLTFLGVMLAITIILDSTPLGAIPLGPAVSATITHIPTIITGIILGPIAGFIMGTSFGIVSLIHAATRPITFFDPLFVNPLISVLPRMFIGVVSYYVYAGLKKLLKKRTVKQSISTFLGGVAGSLTNTGLVFLMLYIVHAKKIIVELGIESFAQFAIPILSFNALLEAVVAAIVTMAISLAYFKYSNNKPA